MNLFKALGKCSSWAAKNMGLSEEKYIKYEPCQYENDMIKVLYGLVSSDNKAIKKAAIFFTETSVAFSNSLISELQYIQNQLTIKELNTIKTAVDICYRSYKDEDEQRREFFSGLNSASTAIRNLMNEVETCCAEIRRVDAMSNTQKRCHFREELVRSVKDKSIRARKCLDAILIGMSCVQYIGAKIDLQNIKNINKEYQSFIDKLLEGHTCLLMHDYDARGGEDEFWLKVPQNAGKLELLSEYFKSSDKNEEDWDFDNIQFSE